MECVFGSLDTQIRNILENIGLFVNSIDGSTSKMSKCVKQCQNKQT